MSSMRTELPVRPLLDSWRYRREVANGSSEQPRGTILLGDAHARLQELATASVDCCVTSPPYYLLRWYGVEGELGLEARVSEWVANQRAVMQEVARVLKSTGSLWLNLGDSYSRARCYGAEAKSLLLAPERLLLKLLADGWIVRNKVVWAKTNPMPHSVGDRLSCTYEVVYFLVRSRSYYFDLNAIRRPHRSTRRPSNVRPGKYTAPDRSWAGPLAGSNSGLVRAQAEGRIGHPLGANPGDVWQLPTGGYRGAHFATFPEQLVTRPILATCPERICEACQRPWCRRRNGHLTAACDCRAGWKPGVVLDPFFGSGTVGVVAESLGRHWLGIELNPDYVQLAWERIRAARSRGERPSP